MRYKIYTKLFLFLIVFFGAILGNSKFVFAQSIITSERRAALERELKDLEVQIGAQRYILDSKRQESASLERDIAIINARIKEAQLAIRARDLAIERLSQDIKGKNIKIGSLNEKLEREKESLAQLLRKTNELDSYSVAEFVLGDKSLSDFFLDLDSFESIKENLHGSFVEIGETKGQTEEEKQTLENKRAEELELRGLQELQRKAVQKQESDKKHLLSVTKGQEKVYQKILTDKEKNAAAIRTALFSLTGAGAIPFEKAYQLALEASAKTKVRPAFILGIIAEESNLGQNVGTGNWKVDMHPTRDRPLFLEITKHLGLSADLMPVSKKVWYGYGGAMGPAQFIPSTWILYAGYECTKAPVTCVYNSNKDRIGENTGNHPPNPWNPQDAFMASAILLKDNGAAKGTRGDERLAALRYLAGWKNATNPSYAFYGNEVMDLADKYQQQIDILKGS